MRKLLEKSIDYLVPVTFLGFFIVLALTFLLRFTEKTTLSGVSLASYPSDTSLKAMMDGSFQEQFGRWIADNFYGHNEAIRDHNQIEYSVFDDGIGDWSQGKDGQLFSWGQSYQYAAGSKADGSGYEKYLEYAESVAKLQELLAARGKDFVYLLTPVKAEIYPDYLPRYFKILADRYSDSAESVHSMLVRALEECGVHYYDCTKDLKEMRNTADFDVFSRTGHHWTLTAAAYEMNTLFEKFSAMTEWMEYPEIHVTAVQDELYWFDQDILRLQNVKRPKLADRYTRPDIVCERSEQSVYLFGTSFGGAMLDSLCRSVDNRAFDSLVYQEYFTGVIEYDGDGRRDYHFTADNTPEDIGVMRYLNQADLIVMEQQGVLGVWDTHKRFVAYATDSLASEYLSLTGSLLRDTTDTVHFERNGFHDSEDWGCWSNGNECSVTLRDGLISENPVYLKMKAHSYAFSQETRLYWNDVLLDVLDVSVDDADYLVEIPAELIREDENTIRFVLGTPTTSPEAFAGTEDSRNLGLGFSELEVVTGGAK